jgi:hypothetical protein
VGISDDVPLLRAADVHRNGDVCRHRLHVCEQDNGSPSVPSDKS